MHNEIPRYLPYNIGYVMAGGVIGSSDFLLVGYLVMIIAQRQRHDISQLIE